MELNTKYKNILFHLLGMFARSENEILKDFFYGIWDKQKIFIEKSK